MTKPVFAILCHACGLTLRDAGAYLQAPASTVSSWGAGRRLAPDSVLEALAALSAEIQTAADAEMEIIRRQTPAPALIELEIASDDAEAANLGWPCVGTQAAVFARLIPTGMAEGYRFSVVPRGSVDRREKNIDKPGNGENRP